jgi:hypothetical protein
VDIGCIFCIFVLGFVGGQSWLGAGDLDSLFGFEFPCAPVDSYEVGGEVGQQDIVFLSGLDEALAQRWY